MLLYLGRPSSFLDRGALFLEERYRYGFKVPYIFTSSVIRSFVLLLFFYFIYLFYYSSTLLYLFISLLLLLPSPSIYRYPPVLYSLFFASVGRSSGPRVVLLVVVGGAAIDQWCKLLLKYLLKIILHEDKECKCACD